MLNHQTIGLELLLNLSRKTGRRWQRVSNYIFSSSFLDIGLLPWSRESPRQRESHKLLHVALAHTMATPYAPRLDTVMTSERPVQLPF